MSTVLISKIIQIYAKSRCADWGLGVGGGERADSVKAQGIHWASISAVGIQ